MRLALRRGEIDDIQKPENKTARYRELEAEFKVLLEKQRKILVKNEFDRIYTTAGASGMNAFTSNDMTGYFITVPSNKLELWTWMESERLLRPVFREFYAERDVVFEERRMRTESTPLGKFQESLEALFWESHPYGWPVIGWPSDIPAISKAQADEFYSVYYSPQNITLILVGDFKIDEAVKLCERYFGRIPRGKKNPPEVVTAEVAQKVEKTDERRGGGQSAGGHPVAFARGGASRRSCAGCAGRGVVRAIRAIAQVACVGERSGDLGIRPPDVPQICRDVQHRRRGQGSK